MVHVPDEIALSNPRLDAAPPEIIFSESEACNIVRTQSLRDIYVKEGYNPMNLNIALSDWGVASFTNRHLTEEIQPPLLRAPEVLLGASW
jgi:serine/threonine-protein kinase SRPK3